MLKLWNTLHRKLETFEPIKPKKVGFYTCGPTVYSPATIGNMRSYLFEDVLERTLLFLGYDVKRVMNITDVGHLVGDGDVGEDKVEREAARQGKTAWDIAKMYEDLFVTDLRRLNILVPTGKNRPHATEYIKEQIALIETLEERGYVYQTTDGVYFDTSKFASYGKLSGQKLEDKEAGARVAMNNEKRHPADFALWKFSPKDAKRQMEWKSPWGVGFPGWHIECSAMARKLLGQPFDIHASGVDHIAVHHENEIAQSEAAFGVPLAHYWVHGEFLLIDGGRMGKSLGNAYVLDDLIAKGFDPLAYRYFCLGAHYRSKLNFTWEALEAAQNGLKNLRATARTLGRGEKPDSVAMEAFTKTLEHDLNTPEALAVLWEMLRSGLSDAVKGSTLIKMDEVFALGLAEIIGKKIKAPKEIKLLAEERQKAREAKDWKKSDELRETMKAKGWVVEDQKDGEYGLSPK